MPDDEDTDFNRQFDQRVADETSPLRRGVPVVSRIALGALGIVMALMVVAWFKPW